MRKCSLETRKTGSFSQPIGCHGSYTVKNVVFLFVGFDVQSSREFCLVRRGKE